MLNKKIILAGALVSAISSTPALANENLTHSITWSIVNSTSETQDHWNEKMTDDSATPLGIAYSFNRNVDKFTLSPRIFLDYNRAENHKLSTGTRENNLASNLGMTNPNTARLSSNTKLRYQYGASFDLAYNFTDDFSTFVRVGYSQANLKTTNKIYTITGSGSEKQSLLSDSSTEGSVLYGLGVKFLPFKDSPTAFKYYPSFKNLGFGLSYERAKFDEFKLQSYKLNVSYNF